MNSFASKTQHFFLKLANAVKRNPVEVGLSLVYTILACMEEAHNIFNEHSFFVYAPALFLFSHLMNKISLSTKFRVLYYISFLPIIPLLFDFPVEAETCFVTTVIVLLAYIIVNRKTKNDSFFISETLNFLFSVASSALLSLVSWLLMVSIDFSINYIFDMNIGWNFGIYTGLLSQYAVFPLLFLVFDNETEDAVYDMKSGNKLFDILFNYVLSPALLVYAFIICLYLAKITTTWSLPKGGIAYIVIGFTVALFLFKGCQQFLSKTYYGWFYKYVGIISISPLILYWIGVSYRINQYGFTQSRVYIVIIGLVLSITAVLFIFSHNKRYWTGCLSTIILLALVTYIPGIKAKDIEAWSQANRSGTDGIESVAKSPTGFISISSNGNMSFDIRQYNSIDFLDNNRWESADNINLVIYGKKDKDIVFSHGTNSIFKKQLAKHGLSMRDTIPQNIYKDLLLFETDSIAILLEHIYVDKEHDGEYNANMMIPKAILYK